MKKAEQTEKEGQRHSGSLALLFAFDAVLQKSVVTVHFTSLSLLLSVGKSTHFKPKA